MEYAYITLGLIFLFVGIIELIGSKNEVGIIKSYLTFSGIAFLILSLGLFIFN